MLKNMKFFPYIHYLSIFVDNIKYNIYAKSKRDCKGERNNHAGVSQTDGNNTAWFIYAAEPESYITKVIRNS